MGNTVHLKNATSEALYVITAPDLGWSIADLCVAAASLAKACYGLTTLDQITTFKTLKTIMRVSSVLSGIVGVSQKIGTVVEAANLAKAFKRDATRIAPGQVIAINERTTENPMEYMNPSAWAAITGALDIAVVILSESNMMFAMFSTNSDHSWIATDRSVVRAKHGTLSTPAPDEGEIQWEGNPAMVSSTADATMWSAETALAPDGWVTRHPVALCQSTDGPRLCGLYVGESGRTHFGRVPPKGGILEDRTLAFNDAWRSGEAPALSFAGGRWVAAMVRDDGSVHIGRSDGGGSWRTSRLGEWSTREGVALIPSEDFIVAHAGRSPSLYLASVKYRYDEDKSSESGRFDIDNILRLPAEYNTELAPALARHNNELFFAYVDTSGAAYVARFADKPERVRVLSKKTTRKPLGLTSFAGRLYLSVVDHRGKAYVISSQDGEEWSAEDRIFPGYITRMQVPLAVSGERLLATFTGMPDLDDWSTTARPRIRAAEPIAIRSQQSGLALTHGGENWAVKMEPFTDAPNQRWLISTPLDEAPDYYRIVAAPDLDAPADDEPLLVLEVAGDAASSVVTLARIAPTKQSQHWRIRWLEDGGFQLQARHSGQVLDVYEESTKPGTTVIQWPFHGAPNQRWRIGREVASHGELALISSRGTTVSAELDGLFSNRVTHIRGWEKFTIRRVDGPATIAYGDKVALQSHDGNYMSAQPSGALTHDVAHIKSWETFTVVPRAGEERSGPLFTGEPFALRSAHGTYVMAKNDGTVDAGVYEQNYRTEWILATAWTSTLAIDTIHPLDG